MRESGRAGERGTTKTRGCGDEGTAETRGTWIDRIYRIWPFFILSILPIHVNNELGSRRTQDPSLTLRALSRVQAMAPGDMVEY